MHAGARASITGVGAERRAENVFPFGALANEQIDEALFFERQRRLPACIGEKGSTNELHIDYRRSPPWGSRRKAERENRKDLQSHEFTLQRYETSPTSLGRGLYHKIRCALEPSETVATQWE